MSKRKAILFQTGTTPDSKPIFGGVYKFYETHGLPLDVIFISFMEKGWMPDWINFYLAATSGGMQHNRIISKLEEALSDSYGKEFSDTVISKLDSLFKL